MTIKIFEVKYAQCFLKLENKDQNQGILYFTWFENTKDMENEDYKETMLHYLEKYNEIVPQYKNLDYLPALIDTRKFFFRINNELQEWTNTDIYPYFKGKQGSKVAFLMPEEFIAQLALKLTTDEEYSRESMNIRHFGNETEALSWLKE